jgi:3-hydroxy-9,10-secoandrosta-1,3,5(10)-triene-9,17-dione monooxygenase
MPGTGSDTWVADDVFVPDYRTIPMSTIADETPRVADDESKFRLPFATVATLLPVGPLLGLGKAALELVVDKAPTKAMHDTFFSRQSEMLARRKRVVDDWCPTDDYAADGDPVPVLGLARLAAR